MLGVGRPPLPLGTFGKVLFLDQPSGRVQARVTFRDYDGQTRLVSRLGTSRAAAERALKAELTQRQAPGGLGALTPATTLEALADVWLHASHGWSTGTQRTYESTIRSQVTPVLGRLRIQEVTPGIISRALTAMAAASGPSAAKSARACLSGMFGVAIEDGVITVNPVRDSTARISVARRAPRALSTAETERLRGELRAHERAVELDLPELVDWMLATGCRLGEALALRHGTNAEGRPLLDLDAGTWEVNATVVRVAGQGLRVQPRPKTAAGWRVIALPSYAVQMVRARPATRLASGRRDIIFPSPSAGTLRDPSNTASNLRSVLDSLRGDEAGATGGAGDTASPWSWVTSHTFRKTVATRLDEAGFTPRQVADQLGHANPSMTLDVYFGRNVVSAGAAQALDR